MALWRLLRDLFHLVWQGHNPSWYHPTDSFSNWALREHAHYLIACRRCDDRQRDRGYFQG